MKTIITITLLILGMSITAKIHAQAKPSGPFTPVQLMDKTVYFRYDKTGNRTKRKTSQVDCWIQRGNKKEESDSTKNPDLMGMKLYPNPTSEFINLSIRSDIEIESCRLVITDLAGKELYRRDNITNKMIDPISIVDFVPGSYLVKLYFNEGTYTWVVLKSDQ
jgi:hypothetical protein